MTYDRMPSIFLAHGNPMLLDDPVWVAELRRWALSLPRPNSILMISAHWEKRPITLAATKTVPLFYDFWGFPPKYYSVEYSAPGAPGLASRVEGLLGKTQSVARDEARGLDHGAYVPLVAMYPDADIPVLQMSLPTMDASPLFELGQTLAPLREEGVLIVGSGFLTHNMHTIDWDGKSPTPSWAADFDAWAADTLARRDVDALLDYKRRAPGVRLALPTHEHFVPVLPAMGAAMGSPTETIFPITGFAYGSFTKRSAQFG
jgi:4,5-DOPA dioxygenase extradiol